MNKSKPLYFGAAILSIAAAFALIQSTINTKDINVSSIPSQMSQSDEKQEPASDMQMRLSQEAGADGMMGMSNSNAELPEKMSTTVPEAADKKETMTTAKLNSANDKMKSAIVMPSEKQVKHYENIEMIIDSAVNDPKIELSSLLRDSTSLTVQQRYDLTEKALALIKEGKLNVEQFASNQTMTK